MKYLNESEARPWKPKPYQERAIGMMMEQAAVGLFLDPGLGKTSTCLAAFSILKEAGVVNRMLLIAPLRVCYSVWPAEIEKWADFNHLRYTIIHGSPAKREAALEQDADIYIINFEGLKWFLEPGSGRFESVSPDVLCVDESSRFKATNTLRFKAIRPRVGSFKRRWILTGTPTPNGIMDIFGQVFLLDSGRALGRYITHFRNKWFYQSGFGGYEWKPLPGAFEEITERIRPLSLRLSAKDNLDLPELRVGGQWDIYVDLPKRAMDLYRQVEDDFIGVFEAGDIVAANAAAAGTKCRQIANGAVYVQTYDDEGLPDTSRQWEEVHDAKITALEDLVEELSGAPLLLFYEFDHDRQRLQDKFGWPSLTGLSAAAGKSLVDQFNAGNIPVLLAHPQSAGMGLNLQEACRHVCWFALTWNLEHYIQGIDRVYRQGQEEAVTVYRILARNTLDETVAQVLAHKDRDQNAVLEALKGVA